MAAQASPASKVISEKVPHLAGNSSQPQYHYQEEQKENIVQRKPLPTIPVPAPGRVHGMPMSPVMINVQSEEWAPRPSAAQVEGGRSPGTQVEVVAASQEEQYLSNNSSEEAIVQDIPHRQNFTTHAAQPIQRPQVA